MNEIVFVLEVHGKRESIDGMCLHLFDNQTEAHAHCLRVTCTGKYWRLARVIELGVDYDIDYEQVQGFNE